RSDGPPGGGRADAGRSVRALLQRDAAADPERGPPRRRPGALRGVRGHPHGARPGARPRGKEGVRVVPSLWILPELPDPGQVAALSAELRLPPSVCALLVQRGFGAADGARRFLRPLIE